MEQKKEIQMNLVIVILLIIAIIAIIIMGYFIGKTSEEKINKEKIFNEKTNELNQKISELEEEVNEAKIKNNQFVMPSLYTSTAKKVREEQYSLFINDSMFRVVVENGEVSINTMGDANRLAELGLNTDEIKINETSQKINGFNKKVVDVFMVGGQHQYANTKFIFLMEDGTVEYSTLQNMITDISTQGKVDGLTNVVKLQSVKISNEHWNDDSVIAIDKENNYYDVLEMLK